MPESLSRMPFDGVVAWLFARAHRLPRMPSLVARAAIYTFVFAVVVPVALARPLPPLVREAMREARND